MQLLKEQFSELLGLQLTLLLKKQQPRLQKDKQYIFKLYLIERTTGSWLLQFLQKVIRLRYKTVYTSITKDTNF